MLRLLSFASSALFFTLACGRSDVEFEDGPEFASSGGTTATGGTSVRGGSGPIGSGGTAQGVGGGPSGSGGFTASGGSPSTSGGTGTNVGGAAFAGAGGSISAGGATGVGGTNQGSGGSAGSPNRACGNGIPETGEKCDLGRSNEDRPALELHQGTVILPIVPVMTDSAVHVFYDYRRASSHTGYEATGRSRIMLHLNTVNPALSLVVHHGQDTSATGRQLRFAVEFSFTGLPVQSSVAVSDEAAELRKTGATTAMGDWRFMLRDSDGGALGALPYPGNWTIEVTPNFSPQVRPNVEGHITHWDFVNGDKSFFGLALDEPIELRAYASPSKCRTSCTVPICGDGIVDGGEICDDGNTKPNDGCSANCRALR